MGSWYNHKGELYWLVTEDEYQSGYHNTTIMPPEDDSDWETRHIDKLKDQWLGTWSLFDVHGATFSYRSFRTLPKYNPPVVAPGKFPDVPNVTTLTKFIGSTSKIAIDRESILSKNNNIFTLTIGGAPLLHWDLLGVNFHIISAFNHEQVISLYQRYIGKDFSFSDCKVKTRKQDWVHITNNLTFKYDGTLVESEENKLILKKYERAIKLIDDYMKWLTPDVILNLYGSMKLGEVFSSRCLGCQMKDMNHVILHMHRKELPFYIMVEVVSIYGGEPPEEYVFNMIHQLTKGNTQEYFKDFKLLLQGFFTDCLIPQHLVLRPRLPFRGSSRWNRNTKSKSEFPISTYGSFSNSLSQAVVTAEPPQYTLYTAAPLQPLEENVPEHAGNQVHNDTWYGTNFEEPSGEYSPHSPSSSVNEL